MIRIIVLLIAGGFTFFFSQRTDAQNGMDKEALIQSAVLNVLQQAHYDPKDLDDEMSSAVFNDFIESLDGRKRFFTQADLAALKVYETQLDDQAKLGSLEFFDKVDALITARRDECEALYKAILDNPFNFEKKESYEFDPEKKDYAANQEELRERWRKSLKYDAMTKLQSRLDKQNEEPKEGEEKEEKKSYAELEKESREAVLDNYNDWYKNFKKVNRSDRFGSYVNAFASQFDPHTEYFNPKEKQNFDIGMSGKLEGIGARLRTDGDLTKVVSIVPGGPAWKGKELEVDDAILKATQEGEGEEPVDLFGMRIDDVVSKIRGPKGTVVTLHVQKADGSTQDISIERDVVNIEESFARSVILKQEGGLDKVGYIDLPKFYSSFEGPDGTSCAADVAKEIEKLKGESVDGIILDLRGNGGGSLRDVVTMSGLFIKDGPIVQVKPRDRAAYVHQDDDKDVQYDGPVVVMVNSFSASASEILAAALQDYDRAVIVGAQTFGKGTVQRFIDLDRTLKGHKGMKPLGQLKLTRQNFYRIDGGSTQLRGVTPDIILPDRYANVDIGEREYDNSLQWSEISGLMYDQEVFRVEDKGWLRERSKNRVAANEQFQLIEEQAALVKKNRDLTEHSLNIKEYKADSEARKEENKKFKKLFKEDLKGLTVENIKADLESINSAEANQARNEDWIKDIKKDIYIEECLSIIADLARGKSYTQLDPK